MVALEAIVFDIGDTLVHAAAPGTPVDALVAQPIGAAVQELKALSSRYRIGAVTDTTVMTAQDVRAALRLTGLAELLEVIVTSVDVGAAKPDPRGLQRVLTQLGVSPSRALFVGDADCDAEAAAALGVGFARGGRGRSPGEAVRSSLTAREGAMSAAVSLVGALDRDAAAAARDHHGRLTKPPGSLGRLEAVGIQLAAIAGVDPPPVPSPAAIAVFAGDHGVVAEGVSAWPQEITAQMVGNFIAGGAAINVLARRIGASLTVVDVGVVTDLDHFAEGTATEPSFLRRNIRRGTANLAVEPAITRAEARAALDTGAAVAADLVASGAKALVTGDMGIGNTTPSTAVIAAFTGRLPIELAGRGAGIGEAALARKIAVVERALTRLGADRDPITVLSEVGGLEIAALAGFIIGGASYRVPVVIDGVVADAALLAAAALCPETVAFCIAGHLSSEPAAAAALSYLGMEPLLDLGLRLGEGSGAALALSLLEAAALILREMATFDDAGVGDTKS